MSTASHIRMTPGDAPANPPSGKVRLYFDSTGRPKVKDSSGAISNVGGGSRPPVTLTFGAEIATDATAADIFDVTLTGNATLLVPTGGYDGQQVLWRFVHSGDGNVLTLGTGFSVPDALVDDGETPATDLTQVDIFARYNSGTGKWKVEDITVKVGVDETAPTRISTVISSDGVTVTRTFSEAVKGVSGDVAAFALTLTGGATTETYVSGLNTTAIVTTLDRTVLSTETGTDAFTQAGGGIRDIANNDLPSYTGQSVTNNSTQVPDVTAPTRTSTTISANGTTITRVFSEAVTGVSGDVAHFGLTMTGGAVSETYVSGLNTASIVTTAGRTIASSETGTDAFTQAGGGIRDIANNDLPSYTGQSVTNNSTQGGVITPDSISGVVGWYKPRAFGLANNADITQFTDSSAAVNHAPQTDAGSRAVYKTNVLDGKGCAFFGPSNNAFYALPSMDFATMTVIVIMKQDASSAPAFQFGVLALNNQNLSSPANPGVGNEWGIYAGGWVYSGADARDNTWHMIEMTVRATNDIDFVQDGVLVNRTSGGGFAGWTPRIGAVDGQVKFKGYMGEIVIVNRPITPTERAGLRAYALSEFPSLPA